MSEILIDATGLKVLLQHARQIGTVDAWCEIALAWAEAADAELRRINEMIADVADAELRRIPG